MNATKKAIHFDLSTEELKKVFEDTREPYNQIKKFMLQNGFEHHQYSGYISKEPMTDDNILSLVEDMSQSFPWLGKCAKKFSFSHVPEEYDLIATIRKASELLIEQIPKKRKRNRNR